MHTAVAPGLAHRSWRRRFESLLAVLPFVAISCGPDTATSPPSPPASRYVGRLTCAECHAEQLRAWTGSHHDLAMQEPTETTVLGDFDDAEFTWFGVTSRFSRTSDGGFVVRTEGADGKLADFTVRYAFGVEPLQQYLVEFPGGRLQTLPLCFDTRPQAEGGQRWFHLYQDERIAPTDPLFWTKTQFNWNTACADCHSTGLVKAYDAAQDRYATRYSELDVSCEACHGPASRHVEHQRGNLELTPSEATHHGLSVPLRADHQWARPDGARTAHRVPALLEPVETETCAPCHSRRTMVAEAHQPGEPLLQSFRPALLDQDLYHADGQILDEVYVYGSFRQSKMYHAGVQCSDCHEPHRLELRAEGNALCVRCHSAEAFDQPSHHHHQADRAGSQCIECHMPSRTYMVVDPRRDHGFRVPRPDLSTKLGTPNACTQCHQDQSAQWAANAVTAWRGSEAAPPPAHFATTLAAARQAPERSATRLVQLAQDGGMPGIARATALSLLRDSPSNGLAATVATASRDLDGLVRLGAMHCLDALATDDRLRLGLAGLTDPLRAVRIEAARQLVAIEERIPSEQEPHFRAALADWRTAQELNRDQPWANTNLGLLARERGAFDQAQRLYEHAIRVGPYYVPAYINLADLHRERQRDDLAEQVLRRGLGDAAETAEIQHALGLTLVRRKNKQGALAALASAAAQRPERARYAFVHAVALLDVGRPQEAIRALESARRRHPDDFDLLRTLFTLHRDRGESPQVKQYRSELQRIARFDRRAAAMLQQLEQPAGRR